MTKNHHIERFSQEHFATIENLTLFTGIKDATLHEILSHSTIIQKNNGVLFLQGDNATHVYVVLAGCIKLFKANDDGDEIILQLVTKGNTFLEAITFSHTAYSASAEIIKNSVILSIPLSVLREESKNNSDLSANMLALNNDMSQRLIAYIEQLTLKTSSQRVGWFLLKTLVEHKEYQKQFQLPYDKSLIASYLGMKPETFSRTIQQLKINGVTIEHNKVSLLEDSSLCYYCSTDIMRHCDRVQTLACKHNSYDS